jgi:hypothetical protein
MLKEILICGECDENGEPTPEIMMMARDMLAGDEELLAELDEEVYKQKEETNEENN